MKTLWNKKTGEAREYESVDAREIMTASPDVYTDVNPKGSPKDPDGDGVEGAPQNVANVENEFRREPVGDNPPAQERDEVIIRNPVTDTPRMAPPATGLVGDGARSSVAVEDMTVAELKEHAVSRGIDLGDATLKADIVKKVNRANKA